MKQAGLSPRVAALATLALFGADCQQTREGGPPERVSLSPPTLSPPALSGAAQQPALQPKPILPQIVTNAVKPPGFAAAYHAALKRAFDGKSWPEALALLEAPAFLQPMQRAFQQAAARPDAEGAAGRILWTALERNAPLVKRLTVWKEAAPRAGAFACDARLYAYAAVNRAFIDAARAPGYEVVSRQRTLLTALSGIALPPQGAARILCAAKLLRGCAPQGPSAAGLEYIESFRAQLESLLLRGLRECGVSHPLASVLEPLATKEAILADLPQKDGRTDWEKLGLRPMPMLAF